MKNNIHLKLLFSFLLVLISACSSANKVDKELNQANKALKDLARPSSLTKSCFYLVYPQGNATDFVKYLFSPLGSAELPIAFDEEEASQMKSVGMATLPPNVKISINQRSHQKEKELVLIPQNNTVIVNGYLPDENQPILETEWELSKIEIDQSTKLICESNLDLGIDPYNGN